MAKKKKKIPNDDLFEGTTMSFGEHLEELRQSLVRALSGLVVGFLIGLVVANYVVQFVQGPLERAMMKYYLTRDISKLAEQLSSEGGIPPEIEQFMRQQRYSYEVVYVEANELARVGGLLPQAPQVTSAEGIADDPQSVAPPLLPDAHMIQTRVWRPLKTKVTALSAQEAFMIWLKAGFITGLIVASPFMFWQIWTFVAAGLYPHEQRYVYVYLPFSLILFLLGAALAFFFVFDPVLDFLFSFNSGMNIDPDPRISEWISFVLFLPLGFGIAFQLPLVMLFIHRIGILGIEAYTSKWRVAILVIFVISMLLTPADPISMLLMAAPLSLLYFLGIALCKWMPRGRSPFTEAYEP